MMIDPNAPENIPWYKSKVLRGIAVAAVTQILSRFHLATGEVGLWVDTALDVASLASAAYAAYSRVKHPLPNITMTKKAADTANGVIQDALTIQNPLAPVRDPSAKP